MDWRVAGFWRSVLFGTVNWYVHTWEFVVTEGVFIGFFLSEGVFFIVFFF
jgi:hypothetical protein